MYNGGNLSLILLNVKLENNDQRIINAFDSVITNNTVSSTELECYQYKH